MTSLKNCDPQLRRYLLVHRLPDIFEAIVSALAVNCPRDPQAFILEKLKLIINYEEVLDDLRWDSFIDQKNRPKNRVVKASVLDFLWSYEDENSQPTPEMYQKAYNLYNVKLKKSCFSAWMRYHKYMRRKKALLAKKLENAQIWHQRRVQRIHLEYWIAWVSERKERQNVISTRIRRVLAISLLRVVFDAWHSVAVDARKTKEYFEITEEGYKYISMGCGTLTTIILNQLPGLRDGCIQALTSECRTLKNVSIMNSPFLSDAAFKCLASCKKLNKIRVEGNNRLTDASVKVLARSCPLLEHVYLVDCPRMTDLALKALATSKHLHVVNVADCVRATNKVAANVIHKCRPFLGHLNLRGCYNLSSESIKLTAQCRNLQDLNLSECSGVT
ncbi:hypothetical protein pdam_00023147, partial [Pocillopora damicornis]